MPLMETERYDIFFVHQMKSVFGDNIELIESAENYAVRGWFLIKFWYKPAKLYIIADAEYGLFSVRLEQEDGCFAHLNQIQLYDCEVSVGNIKKVVYLLKRMIKLPITFYKAAGDGLYRKEGDKFIKLSRDELTAYAHGKTGKLEGKKD